MGCCFWVLDDLGLSWADEESDPSDAFLSMLQLLSESDVDVARQRDMLRWRAINAGKSGGDVERAYFMDLVDVAGGEKNLSHGSFGCVFPSVLGTNLAERENTWNNTPTV